MKNFFNPLAGLFRVNYKHRLESSVELQVFEAKRKYIEVAQSKQFYDSELEYHKNRLNMLVEMLNKLKGPEDEKNSSITSVPVVTINNATTG